MYLQRSTLCSIAALFHAGQLNLHKLFHCSNVLWQCRDVRTAAAMAMADFGTHPEGREMLRREGAIRPLVLLLGEGIESPAAEQAAKALMTLSASDINKVCICMSVFILMHSFRSNF